MQLVGGILGGGAGIADAFSSGAPKMKKFSSLAARQQDMDMYLHNYLSGMGMSRGPGRLGIISDGATPYNGQLAADLTPALDNISKQLKNFDWQWGNDQAAQALKKSMRGDSSYKLSQLDSSMQQMGPMDKLNAPLMSALQNYIAPSMKGVKDYNAPTYSTPDKLNSTYGYNPAKTSTYLNKQYTQDYFQKSVVDPAMRNFDKNIDPRLRDSFAASGAGFSSRRDYARSQALADTNVGMNAQLADAVRQDEQLRANLDLNAQQFNVNAGMQNASIGADDKYRAALANSQNQLSTNQLNSQNILNTNQLNSSNALQSQMANLQSQLGTNTLNSQNQLQVGVNNLQSRLQTNSLNSQNQLAQFQANSGMQLAYDQLKAQLTDSAAARQIQGVGMQQQMINNNLARMAQGVQIGAPQQELRNQLVSNSYADAQRMAKENNPYVQMMYNYIGQPHLTGLPYQSPTWVQKFQNISNGVNTGMTFGKGMGGGGGGMGGGGGAAGAAMSQFGGLGGVSSGAMK
jgi:hypothetical protein